MLECKKNLTFLARFNEQNRFLLNIDGIKYARLLKKHYFMDAIFEEIRGQIHEIRNFLGPLDIKLEALDYKISRSREFFELKTSQFETTITDHSKRIRRIELVLKLPQNMDEPQPPENQKDNP